jgi:glutamate-ammonia-ligase adenylyltransferase
VPFSPESPTALAFHIDPDRAEHLSAECEPGPEQALAVLLATAYPPLRPLHDWQLEALRGIAREGWRVQRERSDLVGHLSKVAEGGGDGESARSELRRLVWAEKARIALRELLPHSLGGAPINDTARELSNLADAALEAAVTEATAHLSQRHGRPKRSDGNPSALVVIGLGKLGGRELNAGSDLDVMFLYDTDDGEGEISLHDYWARVARRVVATIETRTEDGLVWQMDLRLRPEGSRGPVVNSLAAAERYYETWGRLWERAALLRARPAAGDFALGEQFQRDVTTPFVYRRAVDPSIAAALAELVLRSRAELCTDPERDLKLGPGGIRELEFFVQALQLIWGGRELTLRVTPTLLALRRLEASGLVTAREALGVGQAYRLLRSSEHHVQWMTGYQTHLLPDDPSDLGRLARILGFDDSDQYGRALATARTTVRELFGSLAPTREAPPSRSDEILDRLERRESATDDAVWEWLGGTEIAEHLQALARRPDGLLGSLTRERYPKLAPRVLGAIRESPDPEQAAHYLRALFGRIHLPIPYVSILAADPRAVNRLLTVFGSSRFVGDAVVARPDLADVILGGVGAFDPTMVVESMLESYQRAAGAEADPEERRSGFVEALRLAKQTTMVSVAVADLAGEIEMRAATRLLSTLADEVLDRSVQYELGGGSRGLAVIALGKLGGQDVGYGSDLDVMFIYDPAAAPREQDPAAHFIRLAQRIIRLISEPQVAGPGYELDVRLRPSGSSGLLVTSLRSFARYHGVATGDEAADEPPSIASGAAWERQVLLRARACAGDRELGAQVIEVAHTAAYLRGAPPVEEMHRLRLRMERELGQERPGRFDLKTGRGGLLDIEFATQWLQMRHGEDERVRTTDTWQALESLEALGYLGHRHFVTLRDGYLFLRRLEQRWQVLHGAGTGRIDVNRPGLAELARRMGLEATARAEAPEHLLVRYRDVTEAVRRTYLEVLGLTE